MSKLPSSVWRWEMGRRIRVLEQGLHQYDALLDQARHLNADFPHVGDHPGYRPAPDAPNRLDPSGGKEWSDAADF